MTASTNLGSTDRPIGDEQFHALVRPIFEAGKEHNWNFLVAMFDEEANQAQNAMNITFEQAIISIEMLMDNFGIDRKAFADRRYASFKNVRSGMVEPVTDEDHDDLGIE